MITNICNRISSYSDYRAVKTFMIIFIFIIPSIILAQFENNNKPSIKNDQNIKKADELTTKAATLWNEKKYSEAIAVAKEALVLKQKSLPSDHPDIKKIQAMIQKAESLVSKSVIDIQNSKNHDMTNKPVEAEAKQQKGIKLDDDQFARLTALLFWSWLSSGSKPDKFHIALQMVRFKVANNESSKIILGEYNITADEFEKEYDRRVFSKDNKSNKVLFDKITAEIKKIDTALK
ncbi:MAG: hypothetical protein NT106_01570 [Candidatus Sumerlaeota bacterium]|nr:hypothetical protein [Candidatus Sumerlaeota bacterium]